MVSAMNGQKLRTRPRFYVCPTALTAPPTGSPPPLPPTPPTPAKRVAQAAGLLADLAPGVLAVAAGLFLIVVGAFPQALAVI
jgi:hypothetical protein